MNISGLKAKIRILFATVFSLSEKTSVLWYVLFAALLGSCNLTKLVPDDRTLLQKNKIEGFEQATASELNEQIYHRPNKKILGVLKFHLWAYQLGAKRIVKKELQDTNRIRKLLINTVGEPPVLTDTALIEASAKNLKYYIFNKGYFDVNVEWKEKTIIKRTTVTYLISEGEPYLISDINLVSVKRDVYNLVNASMDKSYLKIGKTIDFENINKERERITQLLKNNGYYYFNKSLIEFQLDTVFTAKKVKVAIILRDKSDELLNNIFVINEVLFIVQNGKQLNDTIFANGVKYLLNGYALKMPVLLKSVVLGEKQLYRQKNVDNTYSKLLALGLFKFVNISFEPDSSGGQLKCLIQVAPSANHDFLWEPQVITSERSLGLQNSNLGRNYGIANEFTLRNKNVFGNAEEFNISWRTSFETQFNKQQNLGPLSNISNSVSASLNFPKLIGLHSFDAKENFQNNKTLVSLSFLNEQNANFIRTVFPVNYTWQINSRLTTFYVSPAQFSFNQARVSASFKDQLNAKDSLFIARLFSNYIITGPKFSVFYTQKNVKPNNYFTINSNAIELSGILLSQLFTKRQIFNVPFSQFIRSDLDVRFNHKIDENNRMVYRGYVGFGIPLSGTFLPFERRFFVGGSNSLRGWRPRTVGPGSYTDNSGVQIDKSGEMLLQANIEYRFSIIKKTLEGALFMDAGNIWNLKADSIFDYSKFKLNSFYNEFAINTGLGLRFDLQFFILRADWGIPLHDPTRDIENRWIIKNFTDKRWFFTETLMNIAVGYPF